MDRCRRPERDGVFISGHMKDNSVLSPEDIIGQGVKEFPCGSIVHIQPFQACQALAHIVSGDLKAVLNGIVVMDHFVQQIELTTPGQDILQNFAVLHRSITQGQDNREVLTTRHEIDPD